ncbi:MAG: GNAT family N-acetyltransferase [Clostridia bacterium]|nr:GNAT family N-acetyltransferase [Clostridia bacterium]
MIIREFLKGDIYCIYELLKNELGKNVSPQTLESRIDNMLIDNNYKIFVAESDGKTVGFIGLYMGLAFEVDGKVMRVIALAVKEDFQRKGIGSALIKSAEEYAGQNGVTVIGVNSGLPRLTAHSFYENCGFNKKGYSFIKPLE